MNAPQERNAVSDEAAYRCINAACTHALPRPVAFCPYCGTAQSDQAPPQGTATVSATPPPTAAASVSGLTDAPPGEAMASPPSAPASVPSSVPAGDVPESAPQTRSGIVVEPARAAGAAATVSTPAAVPAAAPDTSFGHTARGPAVPPPPPPPPPAPARRHIWGRGPSPAGPAGPRGRQPIRLRWWVAFLLLLWGVWMWSKPSTRKVERRIEHAIELARECKAREAQDELIALRSANATKAQLERLQEALNDEAASCTRRRQRDKAWRETSAAVEDALDRPTAVTLERARTRLLAFTRRWGEDDKTRALKERIDAERHPLAAPE